jgi:HAD superfamily hydrolase (TIGR01490 family)
VRRLVIVDLDGTLLRGGSEIRFIAHLAVTRRIGLGALFRSCAFTLRYGPHFGRDIWKKNKAYLAGLPRKEIEQLGCSFAAQILLPLLRHSLLDRIARHRAAGDHVLLMTGTPKFLARPLADAIGADLCIATQCRETNGCYIASPPICHPFAGEKLDLAREAADRLGMGLGDCIAYADSRDDIKLLSAVGTAIAVAPDRVLARHARANGWEIISDPQIRPLRRMFAWAGERS